MQWWTKESKTIAAICSDLVTGFSSYASHFMFTFQAYWEWPLTGWLQFNSVQFGHSVVAKSLQPHRLQHTSLPITKSWSLLKLMSIESVMPSNPLIVCHPLLLLQSFPASGSFPMSWLFASGGRSIAASASILPVNIQGWFPLGLIGLISLLSKGLSRVFSGITIRKHKFFGAQPSLRFKFHICTWLLEKP